MQLSKIPEELKLLNEWTKILKLEDWFITLVYPCNPKDMLIEGDGCVNYAESIKSAVVQIVDPKLRESSFRSFNFEETLVHELLHLKFCLLEQGEDWERDLQLRVLHQLIDEMSRILVGLKRNNNGTSA